MPTLPQDLRKQVDEELKRQLQFAEKRARKLGRSYAELVAELRLQVMRGGKRLRPLLALIVYQGYGGRQRAAMLRVAAGLELLHNFLLIHDDIIDRDLIRHGGPNITARFSKKLSAASGDAAHYAMSAGLLGGDLGQLLAIDAVARSGFAQPRTLQMIEKINERLFEVIGGELVDTLLPLQDWPKDERAILDIARYKTASYSCMLPLEIGALCAGAQPTEIKRLAIIGQHLGVAFQLQDDVIGLLGDEASSGKSSGGDLREGKRTLLMHRMLMGSSAKDRQRLLRLIGAQNAGLSDNSWVRIQAVSSGALASVERDIEEMIGKASQNLKKLGVSTAARKELEALSAGLLARKR